MKKEKNKVELVSLQSAQDFRRHVWPIIKDTLGGGRLLTVEGNEYDDFKFSLDRVAGIDAWQVNENSSLMRGLACRVQVVEKPFETLTVRKTSGSGFTEYDKRLAAINNGGIYPEITIQAYLSRYKKELLAVYICKTKDLIALCEKHPLAQVIRNKVDGNQFFSIHWKNFLNWGLPIFVYGKSVIKLDSKFEIWTGKNTRQL